MSQNIIAPVATKDRIKSLDILRGIALLGILILNIQSFSMPGSAYLNPLSYGDMEGLNKWVWILSHVLADSKMMAIFSVLFGAGIILVTDKSIQKTGKSAGLHYRRTFWLLIFGLIHAHLIWHGDILVAYALSALFVFLLKNKSPKTLIIIGLAIISIHTLMYVAIGFSLQTLSAEQLAAQSSSSWAPDASFIQNEIAAVTGSLSEQIAHNSDTALMMETLVFGILMFWRASGLMLIGMALYKLGILSAQKSTEFYKKGMLLGWFIGFPIVILGVYLNFKNEWVYEYSMFWGTQFNYWGSLAVSYGYICAIMLFCTSNQWIWLKDRFAAVGQMAFTNYISQSIICVFIFWGIGFELFGQVSRIGQILIVFAIWILQILWSKPWLDHYKFGPLEWLWRTLTYGSRQPMKR